MSRQGFLLVLVGLFLVAACGGGGGDDAVADRASTHTVTDTAATETPSQEAAGRLVNHDEAGFEIHWPSGCDKISERVSSGTTSHAESEFIFTCDQHGNEGRGVGIHVMQQAHGPDGSPPDQTLVVSMVEQTLQKFGVRTERQRPLRDENVEGMEVQAVEPDGAGEIWVRCLLWGDDIYLLRAWSREGGLFDDPEMKNFFYSLQVDQP